jgi:hypothetical protein
MRAAGLVAIVMLTACSPRAPAESKAPPETPTEIVEQTRVGNKIRTLSIERADRPGEKVLVPAQAKLTIIDYFGTFCSNSKRWMRELEALRKRHPDVAVIAISTFDESSSDDLVAFARDQGATFPISADKDRVVQRAVPPLMWQSIVILDKRGVVVHTHVGTREGVFEEFETKVVALLAAAP